MMDIKVAFCVVLIIVSMANNSQGHGMKKRSPSGELSLMDLVVNGDNERRLWKRQVPRDHKKSTKSNEAVADNDTTNLESTNTNTEPDSSSDPDTGPPVMPPTTPKTQIKNPTKITPSTKATPNIKNFQNKRSNINRKTPLNNPNLHDNPNEPESTTKRLLNIRILPQDSDIPNKKANRRNRTTPRPVEVTEEPEETDEQEEPDEQEKPEEKEEPEEKDEPEEKEEPEDTEEPEESVDKETPEEDETESEDDNQQDPNDYDEDDGNENDDAAKEPSTPAPKPINSNDNKPTNSGRRSSTKPPPPRFPGPTRPSSGSFDRTRRPSPTRSSRTTTSPLIRDSEYPNEPTDESMDPDEEPKPSSTSAPRQRQRPVIKKKPKQSTTTARPTQSPSPSTIPEDSFNESDDIYPISAENNPNSSINDPNSSDNDDSVTTARPKTRPSTKNSPRNRPSRPRPKQKLTKNKTTTTTTTTTTTQTPLDYDEAPELESNINTQLAPRFAGDIPDKNSPNLNSPASKLPSAQLDNPNYPNSQSSPGNPANAFSSASSFGNANAFAGASASASASSTGNANSFTSASTGANPEFSNSWPDNNKNYMNPPLNYPNNAINSPSTSWMIPPSTNPTNFNPSLNSKPSNDIQSSPDRIIPGRYTPVVSISGTFDDNDKNTNYPINSVNCNTNNCNKNFNPTNTNPIYSQNYPMTNNNNNYQPQQYPNQMGYNQNTYSKPNYGNTQYGNPSNSGGYASAGSFANGGVGGYPSSVNNPMYPGNNEIVVNSRFGPGQDLDFGFPNHGADHFKWVQEQNQLIQAKIQAQIEHFRQLSNQQSQNMGSFATASASMNDHGGHSNPNKIYSRTRVVSPFSNWGMQQPVNHADDFPGVVNIPQFNSYPVHPMNYPEHNNFYPADSFDNMGQNWGKGGSNDAWAWGNANAGPSGGSQAGAIGPVAPGIESRFAEDVPSPGGDGSYSSFSSSSTSSKVGPDGKVITTKEVTTGVNNNGKVSVKTIKS